MIPPGARLRLKGAHSEVVDLWADLWEDKKLVYVANRASARKSSIVGLYTAPRTAKPLGKGLGEKPPTFSSVPLRPQKSTMSGPEALLSNLK